MSDQSPPPPKPKPGSLRDRIAAFEKSASSSGPQPGPPPAPRPKPAGFSTWKPKAASPPASPTPASTDHVSSSSRVGGMSASDAKESITKGGSLKERMAALQGKGAFGAPPPPVSPKPALEKPRWKPPPVVQAVVDEEDRTQTQTQGSTTTGIAATVERTISPPTFVKSQEGPASPEPNRATFAQAGVEGEAEASTTALPAGPTAPGDNEEEAQAPVDPEEEERQRRAAIAARMARLGGARVGMAPPVFGMKPPVKRRESLKVDEPKVDQAREEKPVRRDSVEGVEAAKAQVSPTSEGSAPTAISPPDARRSPEYFPTRKNSENASILSTESSESQPAKTPSAMPVPVVPRRAGPPRRKVAKPTAPPPDVPEEKQEQVASPPQETEATAEGETEPAKQADVPVIPSTRPHVEEPLPALKPVSEVIEEKHDVVEPEPSLDVHHDVVPVVLTTEEVKPEIYEEPKSHQPLKPSRTSSLDVQPSKAEEDNGDSDEDSNYSDSEEALEAPAPLPHLPSPPKEAPVAVEPPREVQHTTIEVETLASHAEKDKHAQQLQSPQRPHEVKETTAEEADQDAAEEEARRKRVADRLSKMGGVNPFALPSGPQRRLSGGLVQTSPPLTAVESTSFGTTSPPRSPTSPRLPPVRKPSVSEKVQQVVQPRSPPMPRRSQSIHEHRRQDSIQSHTEAKAKEDSDEYENEDGNVDESYDAPAHPQSMLPPPFATTHIGGGMGMGDVMQQRAMPPQRPPPPPRPPMQVQQFRSEAGDEEEEAGFASSLASLGSAKPVSPPRPASTSAQQQQVQSHLPDPLPPSRPAQPPRRIVPQAPEDVDEDEERRREAWDDDEDEEPNEQLAASHLFVRSPRDQSGDVRIPIPIPPMGGYGYDPAPGVGTGVGSREEEEDGDGSENDSPALPVLHRSSAELVALQRDRDERQRSGSYADEDEDEEENELESDHDGAALPVRPRRDADVSGVPALPRPPQPLYPPPPQRSVPVPPSRVEPLSNLTPPVNVGQSKEILDDEEGDPIDPAFHSPSRRASVAPLVSSSPPTSHVAPVAPNHPPPPPVAAVAQQETPEQDPEQLKRKLFLAKLKLGAPPPILPSRPPPARRPTEEAHEQQGGETVQIPVGEEQPVEATEKEDRAGTETSAQDSAQLRRKSIAERMTKLGAIKFGAAPPVPQSRPPPARRPTEELQEQPAEGGQAPAGEEQPVELTEEEEERARKERIAAKLAGMGGMRIGMMPMGMGMGGRLPPQRSHVLREEDVVRDEASPPAARAVPPSRPPPPPAPVLQPQHDTDSERGSQATSEEGVKVEADESEIEEVNYEDAEGAEQEEEAPPIPSRVTRPPPRKEMSPPPPLTPGVRPPVPTSMPTRRSSVQATRSASGDVGITSPERKGFQSEYVMVEEPRDLGNGSQEAPPLPPGRPPRRSASMRDAPGPTPSISGQTTMESDNSISSQWELPSIPALDFGSGGDLSLSWTDANEFGAPRPASYAAAGPSAKRMSKAIAAASASPPPLEPRLSADDLMAIWGRVGVQVCEVATSLFEKSKKSLIGDGTYAGFIQSVLEGVPNATGSTAPGQYGYLVYAQNGTAVQKRVSEIMPGDIVEIQDAKLKGHKGIQTYHQNVGGAGETLVGVVGEFEAKKSKIRVFHANQHVGQQTVESVSYRLEDLKSGVVKVYRVLEA